MLAPYVSLSIYQTRNCTVYPGDMANHETVPPETTVTAYQRQLTRSVLYDHSLVKFRQVTTCLGPGKHHDSEYLSCSTKSM